MSNLLRDVPRIFIAGNAIIEHKSDLVKFVEEPCLPACEDLYDKNILTYWSSANRDSPNYSFILVRYDFLDDVNKAMADKLINQGILRKDTAHESWNSQNAIYGHGVCLGVCTSSDTKVADVSQALLDLASNFVYQDIMYNIYTPDYLREQSFLYHGTKNNHCFPDLKTAAGFNSLNPWDEARDDLYNKIRMLSFPIDSGSVNDYMKSVARLLGWIYNPSDGRIYRNEETLQRHRRYVEIQNQKMRIMQNQRRI